MGFVGEGFGVGWFGSFCSRGFVWRELVFFCFLLFRILGKIRD